MSLLYIYEKYGIVIVRMKQWACDQLITQSWLNELNYQKAKNIHLVFQGVSFQRLHVIRIINASKTDLLSDDSPPREYRGFIKHVKEIYKPKS